MESLESSRRALAKLAREIDEKIDLEEADQEYTSRGTAVNWRSGTLPAIFRMITVPESSLVLDYGGGTSEAQELATEFLSKNGSEDLVYDPYNRTPSENQEVLNRLKAHGGADVAVCSNVLNVIAEESARLAVLRNIKQLSRPGAPVYFTVYEGDKSGKGRPTGGDQFQNNRKTNDYVNEISKVFKSVRRKGKLIEARN